MSRPLLLICCGLPGVGKSTVAAYAAEQLSAARYRSDEIRLELFDEPTYERSEVRKTYDELLRRARDDLESDRSVVVDATFKRPSQRQNAADVAAEIGARIRFVRVTCPPEIVRERIRARTDDPSEADVSVYELHRETYEPIERDHHTVDNGGSLPETYRQVDRVLG